MASGTGASEGPGDGSGAAVLARLPAEKGPSSLRTRVREARLQLARERGASDPDLAVQLLVPLYRGPAALQAAKLVLRTLLAAERPEDALRELARAAEQDVVDMPLALGQYDLAEQLGDMPAAARALDLVLGRPAQTQPLLDRVTTILGEVDLPRVRQYRAALGDSRYAARLDLTELDHQIAIRMVREAVDEDEDRLREVLAEIREGPHPEPLGPIATVLRAKGRWAVLADEVEAAVRAGGATPEDVRSWQLHKAAPRALIDGALTQAERLARVMLTVVPSDDAARTTLARARDESGLLAEGWPPDPAPREPHTARDGSVLALLGQSLPYRSGGYATRSHGILTGLAARGWQVTAATRLGFPYDVWGDPEDPAAVGPSDVVDGLTYHRLLQPGRHRYPRTPLVDYVRAGADLATTLGRELGAAVVHAASLYDVGLLGMETASRLGVPFVYEMRGLKQLLEDARLPRFAGSERERFFARMEQTAALAADRVFVITEALGHEMARQGVDPARIRVVPNGVHVARFTPREPDTRLREELGLGDRTVIGYAGGLVVYEGLELLLEAVHSLRSRRDDVHLLVVGDGAHERAVHRRARELGLGDTVTFTGRVPHEEVERYLSLVDIAPFPRMPLRVSELISPIKPFESMAMAKAVVVSDVAALTEIVQDGETGRTFRKGDAADLTRVLGELLDEPDERRRLGQRARAWVTEHRDWSRITDTVDAAYRELMPPTRPTRS